MTLLELTRDLLDLYRDGQLPNVPVVFNLSTWRRRSGGIVAWATEELVTTYYVPRKLANKWIKSRRLILILDGLDEVPERERADCVQALNDFLADVGAPGVAIACRSAVYAALTTRLRLYGAIRLEPLSDEQVDAYLDRAGDALAGLRANLENNDDMRTLSRSPLMLSIMSLALQGRSEPLDRLARTGDSHATQIIVRDEVFSLYASRMFKRYQIDDQLQRKMIQRLSWLARRMQQQGTSVFWIERLEPIWLGTRVSKAVYAAMAATGAALLFTTMSVLAEMLSHVRDAMLMGVTFFSWFRFGSIAVPLTIAATTVEVARLLNAPSTRSGEDRTRSKVLSVAWLMLYLLLPSFLVIQGVGPYIGSRLVVGPGLAFWLAYGWQSAWRRSDTDIRLGDDLKWSWAHAIGGALFGAMFGFCAVITDMLLDFRVYEPSPLLAIPTAPFDRLVWTIAGWWHSDPSRFLKMAVAFGTLGAAAFGLKSTLRERTIQPNEGVRRTARRVLTFTLLTMVVLFATYQERSARIQRISVLWIYGTAIIGLLFGGVDILRHSSLRILLAAAGHFPFRAVRFLDCGVSLVFLRRVGGGYVFIHRMLLEYFANLPAAAGPARS